MGRVFETARSVDRAICGLDFDPLCSLIRCLLRSSLFFLIWLASLPPAPSNWLDSFAPGLQDLADQNAELLLRGSATC